MIKEQCQMMLAFVRGAWEKQLPQWRSKLPRDHPRHSEEADHDSPKEARARLTKLVNAAETIRSILAAANEGPVDLFDREAVSWLEIALSLRPDIGSTEDARRKLQRLKALADEIAHAAELAPHLVPLWASHQERPPCDWRDLHYDFLLEVCALLGLAPTLSRTEGKIGSRFGGGLLTVARAFERCLHPPMRAKSAEALFKRLERSRRRARQGNGTEHNDKVD